MKIELATKKSYLEASYGLMIRTPFLRTYEKPYFLCRKKEKMLPSMYSTVHSNHNWSAWQQIDKTVELLAAAAAAPV